MRNVVIAAVLVLASSGCYHATIETGRAPNGVTIRNPWAHSFIAGLVPPSTVETASTCPNGVARVETQLSFLNMVANVVTFGIYSPMELLVECAGGTAEMTDLNTIDLADTSPPLVETAIRVAAQRSADERVPIYIDF